MHSRQTRSAASSTSAQSHASTRSERYAKRQVATPKNNVVDDSETVRVRQIKSELIKIPLTANT